MVALRNQGGHFSFYGHVELAALFARRDHDRADQLAEFLPGGAQFDGIAARQHRSPEEVVELGLDLMYAADHDRFRTDFDRAVMFRDGLALPLLVYRPLRIKNFAAIEIDRHLARRGEDWWLTFSGEEMKAKRPFEAIWPVELVPALERYLDVHRKVLLVGPKGVHADSDGLWIAKGGAPMETNVLAYRIKKRTLEEFGTAINGQPRDGWPP